MIRLQKFLADCGVASRRRAEEYILLGEARVNGEAVTLGTKIDPAVDIVTVNGKRLSPEKKVYIMLHKPEGYITTASDERGRPTVMDLLTDIPERLSPVGRLDYSTSGLLLLTNDGGLLYALTHPKHEAEKTYIARVAGVPSDESLRLLRTGVYIDGRRTAPAKVVLVKSDDVNASLRIIIHEGRNRQVRKMCAAVGHDVLYLKRIATGKLALGALEKGCYRPLTAAEVEYLRGLTRG